MNKRYAIVAALMVSLVGLRSAQAAETEDLRLYWKDGIRADTADNSFRLKIGGRIMNDWAFYGADDSLESSAGAFEDGTEFRRARIYVAGEVFDNVIFKAQYDLAGGDADFKDVYLGLKGLPGGIKLQIGHFKEPFGLEVLTSSKYITFMERSLPTAFIAERNTGLGVSGDCFEERLTWAGGIFRDTDGFGDGTGNGYNFTGRATGLPLYQQDGERLVHVGVSYSHRNVDDTVRFRERPESHLAPRLVDTGALSADAVDLVGVESAVVLGPASLQGEYVHASVDSGSGMSPDFGGYYVQASYFLTGEHRPYKRSHGAFARVKPRENFIGKQGGGPGAVEIALRYSSIDLNDGVIAGGELDDITVGVNWHLNPNTRVMANYVRADLDSVGEADVFQMRFQLDF
ncbi:MAG: OprO/OprP family phosphate-selective porin [Candidatus Binatia bacterium]